MGKLYILTPLLFLGLLVISCDAARILGLFPYAGESHFSFFDPILRALDEAGHEVHSVSHFEPQNVSTRFKTIRLSTTGSSKDVIDLKLFSYRPSFIHFLEVYMLRGFGIKSCEQTYTNPQVQELLQNPPKYDLILMEQFTTDCMYGIAFRIGAPVIGLCSSPLMPWHYERIGTPETPSLTPSMFMGYSDRMSFVQRISNWIGHFGIKYFHRLIMTPKDNAIVRKYVGEDVPKVQQLAKELTRMIFVNQHYSLSGAKPLVPSVVELAGIHIRQPQGLDKELDDFVSSAEHGFVYISWGSNIKASTMDDEKVMAILDALRGLKERVVWKWEAEIKNKPGNVLVRKWLPQRDLLCHPNVKVFWSHGGAGGSTEAAFCGVPVVVTPMYADQHLYGAAFESRGAGIVLPYEELRAERIRESLDYALLQSTRDQMNGLSYAFNNRPGIGGPQETAVFWVEHTIAMGKQDLMKPSAPHIPGFVKLNLDIYASVVGIVVLMVWFVASCKRRCCKKAVDKKVKKN